MAHSETPGYGVGTPWLGQPSLGPVGPDEYLGALAGDPGEGSAPPHGDDVLLGSRWAAPGNAQQVPTAGTSLVGETAIGAVRTSDRRDNGGGASDYV